MRILLLLLIDEHKGATYQKEGEKYEQKDKNVNDDSVYGLCLITGSAG